MAIELLISDYLQQVEKCLVLFERKFGRRDLVVAWREGAIPQSGVLTEGTEYHMHGVGCAVEFPDYDVDFDFATRDEVGFDAWRLSLYAEQFPEKFSNFQDRKAVEIALPESIAGGVVLPFSGGFPGEANDKLLMLPR